jgi:tetratricopeptide (TPR) repeat protein
MGHQKKLLKTCNEILRQFDAQYIPASLLKARTLSAAKKNKAALSTLYKALEVDQNYYQTHYEIAQCLFRDDKTSQVQLHLFSALDNNFNHAASHLLLSKAYLNQGAYGKSLQSALFYFYSIQQCAVSIEYYDELESYFEAHVQNLFDAMGDHTGFRQYYHDRLERITTISVQEKNSIKDSSNFHHDQLFHVLYTEKLIRLKKEGLLEPFFHAAITQAGNEDSILWLQQHPEDLEALFSWIEAGML